MQISEQTTHSNQYNKIYNDVDSIHTQYNTSFQPLLIAVEVFPSQLGFILSSTLILISATYLIYMADLCLNIKVR